MESSIKRSFKREFVDERSKRLAHQDTFDNSVHRKLDEAKEEAYQHNIKLQNEYKEGEIGIDRHFKDYRFDERIANPNKMKRDLRAYVNSLKIEDPDKYRKLKDEHFDNNQFADLH